MNLNVTIAPKDSTFQVRINSEIKRAVEDICANWIDADDLEREVGVID